MKNKKDHPGVYIPPPLLYVLPFLASFPLQKYIPLESWFSDTKFSSILGISFLSLGAILILPALYAFISSKNTLVTIKPAHSLQTSGIYSFSRNPMYLGLLATYIGIAFLMGNDWTFFFVPLIIFIVTVFVIRKEESYLSRAFSTEYLEYKKRVRRWI